MECDVCREQYIGETERTLQERFSDHKGYVANQHLSKATGQHFNNKGHKIHNMKVTIIEKVRSQDPQFRKARESMYIEKFNTKYKGMNRKTWHLLIAIVLFLIGQLIIFLFLFGMEHHLQNRSQYCLDTVWWWIHKRFEIYNWQCLKCLFLVAVATQYLLRSVCLWVCPCVCSKFCTKF